MFGIRKEKKKSKMKKKIIIFSLLATMANADMVGVKDDLSGEVYPTGNVKVIEVLDKIEKIEKEKDKVYYNKITEVKPKDAANQYCYVKVVIKETDDKIIKEEILECADGRKKVDGPSYWELFAQFYYRDVSAPEYCRFYSRPNHVFRSFGKTCPNKDGEWEVQ